MSRVLSRKQKKKKRLQQKNKKIKKMENEDIKGISRVKIKGVLSPKIFITLKIISIIFIIVSYIFFSYLLIFAVIFNISMIYFAKRCEKGINHTFIRSNHLKILKIDSIISIIVLLITFSGVIINLNSKRHVNRNDTMDKIVEVLKDSSTCLTGNRKIFGRGVDIHFGTKDFDPKVMPTSLKEPPSIKDLDLSHIPLEVIISKMTSIINTIFIIFIPITNGLSIYLFVKRKKKFDNDNKEVFIEKRTLTDEEFNDLFLYGYDL